MNGIEGWLLLGGASSALLVAHLFLCLVWGMHYFTYPCKGDECLPRKPGNYGGFWAVAWRGFQMCYCDTRKPAKKAGELSYPLKGALYAGRNVGITLAAAWLMLLVVAAGGKCCFNRAIVAYSLVVIPSIVLIVPDLFVIHANLVGSVRHFLSSGDLPETPMIWGVIMSGYTAAIVLKETLNIDVFAEMQKYLPVLAKHGLFLLPAALALCMLGVARFLLSAHKIMWETWMYLWAFPALIGVLYCGILSVIFILS